MPQEEILELDDADIVEEGPANNQESIERSADRYASVIIDAVRLIVNHPEVSSKNAINHALESLLMPDKKTLKPDVLPAWPRVEEMIFEQKETIEQEIRKQTELKKQKLDEDESRTITLMTSIINEFSKQLDLPANIRSKKIKPEPENLSRKTEPAIEVASHEKDTKLFIDRIKRTIHPQALEKASKEKIGIYQTTEGIPEVILKNARQELMEKIGELEGLSSFEFSGNFSDDDNSHEHIIAENDQKAIDEMKLIIRYINKQLNEKEESI